MWDCERISKLGLYFLYFCVKNITKINFIYKITNIASELISPQSRGIIRISMPKVTTRRLLPPSPFPHRKNLHIRIPIYGYPCGYLHLRISIAIPWDHLPHITSHNKSILKYLTLNLRALYYKHYFIRILNVQTLSTILKGNIY